MDKDTTVNIESTEELVKQAKSGSESAFGELICRYSGKFFQVSYGLLGSREDAEEVVQDAFYRAYKALDNFRGDSSFETWVQRIVINLSRNKYKWNKRRGADVNISMTANWNDPNQDDKMEEMMIPDDKMEPGKILEGVELENRISQGMEQLPEKLKETMVLRHMDDLPYEKIANLLECKVGTVKSRLARGRELLRSLIYV